MEGRGDRGLHTPKLSGLPSYRLLKINSLMCKLFELPGKNNKQSGGDMEILIPILILSPILWKGHSSSGQTSHLAMAKVFRGQSLKFISYRQSAETHTCIRYR